MSYEGESLDMSLFRQMYLIVSALPTILLLLTFVLWTMLEGPGAAESTGPDGMPAWQIALFAAIALASLPMALFV
ncbi:MAG: hypothetical protein Q8M55_05275, partial [Actinomycetota bacterium]|nr:hypothetical protein [Actinomycetota bacterium]